MESNLEQQLERLAANGAGSLLKTALRGIEKEGLRVDPRGSLSQEAHPPGLGSALTNDTITTDFSEALLEFVTPTFADSAAALRYLEHLHGYTYRHLGDELVWAGSMPCHIPDAEVIPIARYGSSNIGRLKHVYRVGLSHRYGKMMQTIAGIHYNFSLADDFWQALQQQQENSDSLQTFRSSSYFKMIRNVRRYSWLLVYLFGASPALDASYLQGKKHNLHGLHDRTLYLPFATSLRMSDLGYTTKAQSSLSICFNHLQTYLASLDQAIHTVYPPYEKIGVKVEGRYRQLNSNILQIENEYYSDVRPKRFTRSGEKPLHALRNLGVEYIEVRLLDINPFLPVGIDHRQALFLDAFLISCLLMNEAVLCPAECTMVIDNLRKVLIRGREPGLRLVTPRGETTLAEVGSKLIDRILMTAELLDRVHQTNDYTTAVNAEREKLEDPTRTPSARVLRSLTKSGLEYAEWILQLSRQHKESFLCATTDTAVLQELANTAEESLKAQKQLELTDILNFDQFLAEYLAR